MLMSYVVKCARSKDVLFEMNTWVLPQVGYLPTYILFLAGEVKPTHFNLESFVEWINE